MSTRSRRPSREVLDDSSAKFGDYTGLDEDGAYVVANAAGGVALESGYHLDYELLDLGRERCNDYSIGIELEGVEGGPFENAQYEALSGLCAAIAQHYPVEHIAGHEHIAPGRKQDPGAGFDWRVLRASLAWPAASFPA